VFKFYENGRNVMIKDIAESIKAPPYLANSKVDMASFVDLHKVVVKRISTFPIAQNGGELKWGRKWRVEVPIFKSGREFRFTKDP